MNNLQQYWKTAHINSDRHILAGNTGKATWKFMDIANKIIKGNNILEIGIGLGHSIREMAKKGANVSAMDIVPEAFKCVKDVVENTYLAEIDELPEQYFDLVISFTVACHQSDDVLRKQIKAVIQSLKPKGIFALAVASKGPGPWPKDWQPEDKSEMDYLEAGAKVRSKNKIKQIVKEAGGHITSIGKPMGRIMPNTYIMQYPIYIVNKEI